MNPLELQVLSIVCGVAGNNQGAPSGDSTAPRQPMVALPQRPTEPARPQRIQVSR